MRFTQPWGFSKLDSYRACPAKFKYQYVDKIPVKMSSPAMERGAKLHEAIEAYLNGWLTTLPTELADWKEALDDLKATNFKGEQALGFDKDWNMLSDWFHPKTWLRVKMDAYHFVGTEELVVIDFKSGTYRVPSTDQVELYAVAGHALAPVVKTVKAQFWFLDTQDVYSKDYTAEELVKLRKKYETESNVLYTDEIWQPTPSLECRWCPFSKTKNGLCKY